MKRFLLKKQVLVLIFSIIYLNLFAQTFADKPGNSSGVYGSPPFPGVIMIMMDLT